MPACFFHQLRVQGSYRRQQLHALLFDQQQQKVVQLLVAGINAGGDRGGEVLTGTQGNTRMSPEGQYWRGGASCADDD